MKSTILPPHHYASAWPIELSDSVETINALGQRYATLPAGAEKEQALLDLSRAFHPYLMKYLSMICRGHVPTYAGGINRDAKQFIRYFLPKGTAANRAVIGQVIRQLHLAFECMETGEIYDVRMEQFLHAAAKYDPHYTEKVKQVVEVIENALSGSRDFGAVDVNRHLEFDCHRHLRMLCRRGFLTSESREGQKYAFYVRTDAWPPPASCDGRGAIAHHLPKGLAAVSLGRGRPGANTDP